MVPEIRHDAVQRYTWADQDTRDAEVANLTTDGSEETIFDMDEDRGYDLGEGD